MSGQESDNKTILGKTLTFPQKVALVKPSGGGLVSVASDGKSTTTVSALGQPQQQGPGPTTYRTINQSHMRLVMPASGSVPTPQIIQTHLMPQAILKSVDPSGRSQIALPARSLAQTSITVTRSPTPTSFVPRATNVTGARATVVTNPRTPTPPTANIANFVRNSGSTSRTPSPAAATVISAVPGTTWMSTVPASVQVGVQGTHLIRASINPTVRPPGRVLTQSSGGPGVIAASVASSTATPSVSSLQVSQAGVGQSSQVVTQQTNSGGQILATVQCPRPQTATLVYSNVGNHAQGQPFVTSGPCAQRLTLSHTRPIRPIQLTATNNRITGTGLRTANISIRPPNVPGLTSTGVLGQGATVMNQQIQQQQVQQGQVQGSGLMSGQQQQQRTLTTGPVSASLVSGQGVSISGGTTNLATRIIQVQAPQTGGTTQVINTGRIAGNLMTLTPVMGQVGTGGGNVTSGGVVGRGGIGGGSTGAQLTGSKVQPSLTITHVGKITSQGATTVQQQQQQGQMSGGGHMVVTQAPQQHQQTMIVTMGGNQGGGPLSTSTATTIVGQQQQHHHQQQQQQQQQGHHQMMSVVSSGASTTMLPLSGITTTVGRPGATGIVRTLASSQGGNMMSSSVMGAGGTATLLPLSKVLSQNSGGCGPTGTGPTVVETQLQQAQQAGSIFIHSRSPNPVQISGPGAATSGGAGILTLQAATASTSLNNIISAVPYTVQSTATGGGTSGIGTSGGSSFAVVTNRGTSLQGVMPVATSIMGSVVGGNSNSVVSSAGGGQTTHQIITMTQPQQQQQQQSHQGSSQHIVTQANAPGKIIAQSARPGILRKRDNEGIVITATSGSGGSIVGNSSVLVASSANSGGNTAQVVKGVKNLVPILHAIGSAGNAAGGGGGISVVSAPSAKMEIIAKERTGLYVSPPAGSPSDGSTTVSATSSPGVDKQQLQQQENQLNSVSLSLKLQSELKKCRNKEKEAAAGSGRSREPSPRKKMKRQNDPSPDFVDGGGSASKPGNKENSHPTTEEGEAASASAVSNDVDLKKPRPCSLLEAYRLRHNWKAAHNHFQRYSDVKPREERRPTVIDLANQAHVTQKVNGWKIYHLSAQMEDLCEMESQMYDKLSEMLHCMEAHDQSSDVDRVNELLKGNMQRSKIINDGITESKKQMMKVFDHKSHITDIIHRCASKRNFKKREKI